LIPLSEAHEYVEQTSGNSWEFAVEIDCLTALGLTLNDSRWLRHAGLVEDQFEVTLESDNGGAFWRTGDLTFPEHTCCVLTENDILIVRRQLQSPVSDNGEFREMEGIEFGDEIIMITVTISHSFEGTDLIVDAFESASRDWKVVQVEDAGSVSFHSLGHRLQVPRT
jgi:hypothetical protein